jgi:hypothetical protein
MYSLRIAPKLVLANLIGSVNIPSQDTLDVDDALSDICIPFMDRNISKGNIFLKFKAKAFNSKETLSILVESPLNGSVIVLVFSLPGIEIILYTPYSVNHHLQRDMDLLTMARLSCKGI